MTTLNYSAAIKMCGAKRTFSYDGTCVLTLSIFRPEVTLPCNPSAEAKINCDLSEQAQDFYCYASGELYRQAIDDYKYARENGFPFRRHEAMLQYEITYNQHCHLSLYSDQYTYTGGAHGGTVRASHTWGLTSGCELSLASFFPSGQDYRALVTQQLLSQADRQMQENPMIYFDEYRALIAQHFNDNSYFLTPAGVAVYYQQYEIAPYATGIVVFTIPYETLQWQPACGSCE